MGKNKGRFYQKILIVFECFDNISVDQEQMVLRHHNEAESLNAVQKMDWEWKLSEINSGIKVKPATDDLHVPMVQVNEDFDQLVS